MTRSKINMKFGGPAMFLVFAAVGVAMILPAPATSSTGKNEVPAHHTVPPTAALPDTLDATQFKDGLTQNSYAMAAKIKPVLYEQPCYCFCDRTDSHQSLLDCYVGTHATTCNICRMEGIFAYEQTQKGQTPEQIRKAIIRGDWKKLNPKDYEIVRDLK